MVRTEAYGYAHNKIGAYLDDGSINALPLPPGSEVNTVVPQVYTDSIIRDTLHWVKISGSFTASGTETHISIGNFFPNTAVDTTTKDCLPGGRQSILTTLSTMYR